MQSITSDLLIFSSNNVIQDIHVVKQFSARDLYLILIILKQQFSTIINYGYRDVQQKFSDTRYLTYSIGS